MHLVLLGIEERPLRVAERRRGLHPADERVGEIRERPGRVLTFARGVCERGRLGERRGLRGIELDLGAADVDERVRARALVPEPGGKRERPLSPLDRPVGVLGEHCELRKAAVRARQLDRLAQRLQDGDGLDGAPAGGVAVAGVPVEAREHPRPPASPLGVAERLGCGDRALDRPERVLEPPDEVRRRRQLLEHHRLLREREPLEEIGGAPVVRVRLAVRLQSGRPPGGDERVPRDDLLRSRGLRVMDDLGGVHRQGSFRVCH